MTIFKRKKEREGVEGRVARFLEEEKQKWHANVQAQVKAEVSIHVVRAQFKADRFPFRWIN